MLRETSLKMRIFFTGTPKISSKRLQAYTARCKQREKRKEKRNVARLTVKIIFKMMAMQRKKNVASLLSNSVHKGHT